MSATTSPGTGSGRKARIETRRATASQTSMAMGSGLTLAGGARQLSATPLRSAGKGSGGDDGLARRAQTARSGPSAAASIGRLFRWALIAVLVFGLVGPVAGGAVYRFVPPPMTWLMVERMFEGHGFDRRWVPLRRISPQLVRSVIGAEDAGSASTTASTSTPSRRPWRTTRTGQEDARRLDDQPADRQERLPVAAPRLCPQGPGGLVHRPDRGRSGASRGSWRSI